MSDGPFYVDDTESSGFGGIKLPMIRRVVPSMIASELLSVQPMTAPTGSIFTLKYRHGDPIPEVEPTEYVQPDLMDLFNEVFK